MKHERIIFHIDVNSAFLAWTAAYKKNILGEELDLRDVASIVGGSQESRHGIVLAKSAKEMSQSDCSATGLSPVCVCFQSINGNSTSLYR